MHLQILGGSRCSPCTAMEKLTRRTLARLDLDATVEKVTDERAIIAAGVISVPTLIIDGTVVITGRVPSRTELEAILNRPHPA